MRILRALARAADRLVSEGRGGWFSLIRVAGSGGRVALKPGIDGDERPTEGDVLDFEREGLVHTAMSDSTAVVLKFMLTAGGRRVGMTPVVAPDLQWHGGDEVVRESPAPTADELLAEVDGLERIPDGSRVLAAGGALVNELLDRHGPGNLEMTARRVFELRDDGLVALDDIGGEIDQISDAERLGMATNIRLTAPGRDRASGAARVGATQLIQIIQGQVAFGDINNYTTFVELLERADTEIDRLDGVTEDAREEAKGLLAKLRAGAGSAASGAVGEAGGALLGAILKQLLGMH